MRRFMANDACELDCILAECLTGKVLVENKTVVCGVCVIYIHLLCQAQERSVLAEGGIIATNKDY